MKSKRESTKTLLRILGLSLLIHGSGFLAYYSLFKDTPEEPIETPQAVKVQLAPPNVPPKQEPRPVLQSENDVIRQTPEEQHLPTHNAEEFATRNQENRDQNKIKAGGGEKSDPVELTEAKKAEESSDQNAESSPSESSPEEQKIAELEPQKKNQTSVKETISSTGESARTISVSETGSEQNSTSESHLAQRFQIDELPTPNELAIPRDMFDTLGNLELLSDSELSDTVVEDPFSEKKSNELKLVNRYLERMTKQVHEYWINPYQGREKLRGIIKLELNVAGFVESAYIFRSSGHRLLDISVLDAIRAVPRFEVPENPVITARYYTNLSFFYSSIQDETEIMPFEEGYADARTRD